jgi:RHS repeat-associated protein
VVSLSYDTTSQRLQSVTDANDFATRSNITNTTTGQVKSETRPNGVSVSYAYFAGSDLLESITETAGVSIFTHDAAGNLLTARYAKGQLSSFTYDAGNRLKSVDRAGLEYDETYSYDTCSNGAGRLCRIVNGLGEQVDFEYDPLGRVSKVSNNGVSVGYAYNAAGSVTRITYPSGRVVLYDYNAAGQVTAVRLDHNGAITTLASNVIHQPFGPVRSWTYGNGLAHTRGYDQQYWPRSISTPNVSVLGISSYDGNGNLSTMAIDGVAHQFGYDPLDRLETADGSFGSRVYGYDSVGNRTSLNADGTLIGYGYDPQSNRLASETGWSYQRDANGNTEEKRSTDGANRGFGYAYSPHNRLTAVYDLQAPLTPLGSYRYNGLGQRSTKLAGGRATRFAYGLSPLLLAEVESGAVVQEYVYLNGMPLALLGTATVSSGPPSFDEVKDNGAATGDWVVRSDRKAEGGSYLFIDQKTQQADDSHEWSWNVPVAGTYQLQVSWVPPNNAGISQQVYRLNTSTVTVSGAGVSRGGWAIGPTVTLAAGPATLTLSEALNGSQRLFADAARLVLIQATLPAPDYQYVHTDHLGTPRAVTDKNKRVVWRASYDPFGAATVSDDPDADGLRVALNLRFAGQYFDSESGLHYNYFRDYDSNTGRYIESDPIGLDGGLNSFSYSIANPVNLIDPTGLATAVVINGTTDGNPFGHTAIGTTGFGIYSYGNTWALGGSMTDYLLREATGRETLVVVINTSPEQERAINEFLSGTRDDLPPWIFDLIPNPFDTCATRTNSALEAGGMTDPYTAGPSFPTDLLAQAEFWRQALGGQTYRIQRNSTVIPAQLYQFNRP